MADGDAIEGEVASDAVTAMERGRRADVERYLEGLVGENRFTIAIVFPAVGAVSLVASAQGLLPEPLSFNPLLILVGVFVMRSPLITGLLPLLDRRAVGLLSVLLIYSYAIEYVGATTGVPYGDFAYGVSLGPMLFDTIPIALGLFFVPLVLNSYLLCLLLLGDRANSPLVRLPVTVALVILVDLVLDPAAVALGFWTFDGGGIYYGVPLVNYGGWLLSASLATLVVDAAFDRLALLERVRNCEFMLDDMVSFVLLWGAIGLFYRAWIPVVIAIGFALSLVHIGRFDVASTPRFVRSE